MTEHWLTRLRRGTEDRILAASDARTIGALFQWWTTIVARSFRATLEEINR